MHSAAVVTCILALSCSVRTQRPSLPINSPGYVPIISQNFDFNPVLDGSYSFNYVSGDGSTREETSVTKDFGTENESQSVQGSYSYVSPEGTPVTVNYVADENGFRASGSVINPGVGRTGDLPLLQQRQAALLGLNPEEARRAGYLSPETARLGYLNPDLAKRAGYLSPEAARLGYLNPDLAKRTGYWGPEAARLGYLNPDLTKRTGYLSPEAARLAYLNPESVKRPGLLNAEAARLGYLNPELAKRAGYLNPEAARLALLNPELAKRTGLVDSEAARLAYLRNPEYAKYPGYLNSEAARLGYDPVKHASLWGNSVDEAAKLAYLRRTGLPLNSFGDYNKYWNEERYGKPYASDYAQRPL